MNQINLYCKANKRKRNGEAIGAYAYIIKDAEMSKEIVHILHEDIRVAKLELLALVNALRDLDTQDNLARENRINIYVSNEYILEELLKGAESLVRGTGLNFNKGIEYTSLWEEIEALLIKSNNYSVTGLNKKDRGEGEEEIKRNMGILNKIVCDEINGHLRSKVTQ